MSSCCPAHYFCSHPSPSHHFHPPWVQSIHRCLCSGFFKAFDARLSLRCPGKILQIIADIFCNWIESFFHCLSHCTEFGYQENYDEPHSRIQHHTTSYCYIGCVIVTLVVIITCRLNSISWISSSLITITFQLFTSMLETWTKILILSVYHGLLILLKQCVQSLNENYDTICLSRLT